MKCRLCKDNEVETGTLCNCCRSDNDPDKSICIQCFKYRKINGGGRWIEPLMCDECKEESQKNKQINY